MTRASQRDAAPVRVHWRAVALFIGLAFGLAWLVALPLWLVGPDHGLFPVLLPFVASVMMFTPLVATLVTMWSLRLPPQGERLRGLGMWPLRPARRTVWFVVGGLLVTPLIVGASLAIAALLGWIRLDLTEFSGFQEMLDAQLGALGSDGATAAAAMPPIGVLVALQLAMIPLGGLINSVFAFGEELGWRGWLLPALTPLGTWPALLLSGAIWGLWHAPLILLGYNYGLLDWRGVALMTVGCTLWGVLFGWTRLRTGSVWPAVVGHGALNASAGLSVLWAQSGESPTLALVSPVGVAGWIAVAITILINWATGQFSRRSPLGGCRDTVNHPRGRTV